MSNLTRRDPLAGGFLVGDASGMKEVRLPRSAQNLIRRESHKEGPTLVGGSLMSNLTRRDPLAGGSLVGDASGMKDIRLTGSAQNVKRQKNIYRNER